MEMEKIVTPKEAAQMLDRSRTTIYRLIKQNIIRPLNRIVAKGDFEIPISEIERLQRIKMQNKREG